MKKNGYLRRFLAMFLALVMIMADSSVTTFAATVGRVKQQNATAESSSQCSVQMNVAEELDKIDYEKMEKKNIKKRTTPYEDRTHYKTVKEFFIEASKKYPNNSCIL